MALNRQGADGVTSEVLVAVVLVPSYLAVDYAADAESTSMSPSPSISVAYTLRAPFAAVVIICVVKFSATVVFIPGDFVVKKGRGKNVDVAVAIHVRRVHTHCSVRRRW